MKTPPVQRAASRKKLAARGQALGDGSFPVPTVDYLKRAIRSVGRAPASRRPALRALIRKRARQLKAGNTPGVKGTWPFQAANKAEGIDLATMTRRLPVVRGAADVQMSRSGPGVITVQHKSTGTKIGTITPAGRGFAGTHASGVKTPASGSQQGALAGLIAAHNRMARKPAAEPAMTYAAGEQETLDLAGSLPVTTPASSSSNGPRVTSMGAGKAPKAVPPVALSAKLNLSPAGAAVYAKLVKKGMKPAVALAMARRAAAMKAKTAA